MYLCRWEVYIWKGSLYNKLTVVHEGLQLAKQEGVERIMIEVDAQLAVNILKELDPPWNTTNLVKDIFGFLNLFNDFHISHVFRKGNQCANWLATSVRATASNFVWTGNWPQAFHSFLLVISIA